VWSTVWQGTPLLWSRRARPWWSMLPWMQLQSAKSWKNMTRYACAALWLHLVNSEIIDLFALVWRRSCYTWIWQVLYDWQVHHSNEGLVFRGRLLAMRSELMQSPWLIELAALHINLAKSMNDSPQLTEAAGEFSCDFDGAAAILSCNLLDSVKLDINLTCSICLVSSAPALQLC